MTTARRNDKLLPTIALFLPLILIASNSFIHLAEAPETHYSEIQDFSFQPENLAISKGDTVAWTNNDPVIHTLWFVFEINESTYTLPTPIPPGQSWSHTFEKPAKLKYYCFESLWITGRLRIVKILGDINGDGTVNIYDLHGLGKAYQTVPNRPGWNEDADINFNYVVDNPDLTKLSNNYGKTDP